MTSFAIVMGEENSYSPIAPRVEAHRSLKNSSQHSAISIQPKHEAVATLCLLLGLGLGLGHPWVTQGPRKGHPRATQAWRKGGFA